MHETTYITAVWRPLTTPLTASHRSTDTVTLPFTYSSEQRDKSLHETN